MKFKRLFESDEIPDIFVRKKTHGLLRDAGYVEARPIFSTDDEDAGHVTRDYGKMSGSSNPEFPGEKLERLGYSLMMSSNKGSARYEHPNGHQVHVHTPIQVGDSYGHPVSFREITR